MDAESRCGCTLGSAAAAGVLTGGATASGAAAARDDFHRVTILGMNWCGYTQKQLAQIEENRKDLEAKRVDVNYVECADEKNKALCSDVKGFPHILNDRCDRSHSGFLQYDDLARFAVCHNPSER